MTTDKDRAAKIAALNDAVRHDPGTREHGRIVMTRGVSGHSIHAAGTRQAQGVHCLLQRKRPVR